MHAFADTYLPDAMRNLAEAFDYAANACDIPVNDFGNAFLASGLAGIWESGSPKVLSGLSGTELVREAFRRCGAARPWPAPRVDAMGRTPEYWCGWVLAYYQWKSARPFSEIFAALPPADVVRLYHPLHEASEDTFADRADAIVRRALPETRLRRQRLAAGLSQSKLAARSGVNIRNIQQYEQRAKDINRAAAISLQSLARALGCRIESLLEPDNGSASIQKA